MKLSPICIEYTEWATYKALVFDAGWTPRVHYSDEGSFYNIFSMDGYCYEISIAKPSADATDFENNHKSGCFEVK